MKSEMENEKLILWLYKYTIKFERHKSQLGINERHHAAMLVLCFCWKLVTCLELCSEHVR